MPGPSERSPSDVIIDFFDGAEGEPFTAPEIANQTGHSVQTAQETLNALVERGLLRSKQVAESEQVWWLSQREEDDPLESISVSADATNGQKSQTARQRLMEQHRQLAQFVTQINITDDLDKILKLITEEARDLVGAHQSVTSRTINQNWEQAINAVSLSEKYDEYRDYDTEPDGSGIYSVVCERNQPMRMTQAELESHPAWKAFGDEKDEHPPMEGWLAVPIIGSDGQNMGLIQLSDKYEGQFTEADEAILIQLANIAAAAIENARLYNELRESEERYRRLVENVPGMVYRCRNEREWPMEFVSDACRDLTGYDPDALERDEVLWGRDVIVEEDREEVWDVLQTVVTDREPFSITYRIETTDGKRRWVRDRGRGIFNETGDLVEIEGIISDITEHKEREQALEESNERLEQFAYATSHDLQEPLRMVSTYLQLIEERYGDTLDEDGREFIDFAVNGADRMREMIDALLEYSRVETEGQPFEPVDLDDILDEVIDDLQFRIEESEAEISRDGLPTMHGDPDQLREVFQNLLDNAIEYSGDAPPEIHVGADRDGDRWVITVDDEGIGIDPDDQDRVFEVFQRLHTREEHEGTGIGLALCERIVERHGGEIWVESEPGEGSTFFFTLSENPGINQ